MFAVIKTGGKQYKVAKDQLLAVERLAGEAGDIVAIESVLLLGDAQATTLGAPYVEGATVAAEIVEQKRGPKIIVFKKKRRKKYRRRHGHRQDLTLLKVTEILTDGKKPKLRQAAPKPAKVAAPSEAKGAKTQDEVVTKESPAKKTEAEKPAPKQSAKRTAAKADDKKPAAKKAAPKAGAKKSATKAGGAKKSTATKRAKKS